MTSDYKKYSLEKLQEWVHDAMNSDASPHEIYSAIREAVGEDYYYHKDCISRAYELLALLNGNGEGHIQAYDEYVEKKENLVCDKDNPSPECQKSWNDFWEEYYYPEEYEKNKVKKWILPVEEVRDEDTDEDIYCVTFPADLLEAANLKEGDEIEWVEKNDGSYLLRKVIRPLGMDEC